MKSLTAVCQTGASMPGINPNGRISRPQHPRTNAATGENAEMKMYLSKLKDLVPFMPKNRKLSKLEIIQHVIDYICDLQSELETHPEINNFDAAAAFTATQMQINEGNNGNNGDNGDNGDNDEDDDHEDDDNDQDMIQSNRLAANVNAEQQQQQMMETAKSSLGGGVQQRQPLVDRHAPNTILPSHSSISVLNSVPAAAAVAPALPVISLSSASTSAAAAAAAVAAVPRLSTQQQILAKESCSSSTSSRQKC